MRLSEHDREILACAYFQADAPLSKIAQETGIPQHTVRRSLDNLLESGYITRHAYINPARLGFNEYYLLWAISNDESGIGKRVIARIAECEEVSWVAQIGAPLPYEAAIYARNVHDAARLLDCLTSDVGAFSIDKKITTLLSSTSFVPKFLSTRAYSLRAISYRTDAPPVSIDELDHNILRLMVAETFSSYGQVARTLGVAQSTVTYRIERLKREGVVLGEGYFIRRSDLVGMSSFRLHATLKRYSPETRQQLFTVCRSHPAVYFLSELLGEIDVEIAVRVYHPREIPAVIESLRRALPNTFARIDFYPDIENFKAKSYSFVTMPHVGMSGQATS
jgi:Lrp/AsnC family transcriptional regulator